MTQSAQTGASVTLRSEAPVDIDSVDTGLRFLSLILVVAAIVLFFLAVFIPYHLPDRARQQGTLMAVGVICGFSALASYLLSFIA